MHLVMDPDYMPMDSFIRTPGPLKYCDWPHILLLLEAGEMASYTVYEATEPVPVTLVCCAAEDNVLEVRQDGRTLYRGTVPESEDWIELPVGTLTVPVYTGMSVICSEGAVLLKEIRFGEPA